MRPNKITYETFPLVLHRYHEVRSHDRTAYFMFSFFPMKNMV
ncbi:MAG: hypothetical protein OJF50_000859 [Nitrospira sp.]|nr:hypothetical protein [Nitrospira sp.]